jgi:hypothetical protein
VIWQVNTPEDYEVVEADTMEVDEQGNLIAVQGEDVVAGWAPGFWYGYKTTDVEVKVHDHDQLS